MKILKFKKVRLVLLVLILLLASFFRLYMISNYAIFLGDEGRDALVVRKMIVDKRPTLLGPSTSVGDLYLGPAYYYMMVVPLYLARFDPVGPAIMVALLGVGAVFLLFKLGEEFFSLKVGLIASLLYALSQSIIDHSRFSWNPNPMPFFALLSVLSLLRLVKKKEGFWFLILGACLGIVPQLHYVGLVFVLTCFFLVFKLKPKVNRKWYFGGLLAFLLVLAPMFAFELRHDFILSSGFWRFLRQEEKLGFSLRLIFEKIIFAFSRLFGHFVSSDRDWLGVVLAIFSFVPFVGLWGQKRESKMRAVIKPAITILAFWWFLGLVGAAFYVGELHDHYLGFLFPVPFLLMGLFFEKLFKTKFGFLGVVFLLFVLGVNFLNLDFLAGRGPNFQMKRARFVGESIAKKARGERFNLALISPTNDFRAMNYRYFTEVFGATPEGFENYADIDFLYVIKEQESIPITDVTAWEIDTFGTAETVDEWYFEEFGFKVVKLKKISGKAI